ncbi:TetR/AcrR family transcriptional regulator [Bacillus infantis]|uniref:TetR/AcrR family transcriptional regulator n=1 Tax=Bacillus infantis TaxID=324767 RepID=UPI001F10CCE1|nr:TetR family transcriptional regulator [Bacillus infantis]
MPKVGMEELRKEQIIAGTKSCIIKKGISHLSMKDIAAEADISTGIIYHYFKNKEELLLQVLKDSFRKSHEEVIQTVEPLQSPQEKLLRHIENINAVPKDNADFYPIFLNFLGEAVHNPDIRGIVIKFLRNLKSYIDGYYPVDGTAEEPGRLKNLPVIVYALGLGLGIMWTMDKELYDIDDMEASLKDLILSFTHQANS